MPLRFPFYYPTSILAAADCYVIAPPKKLTKTPAIVPSSNRAGIVVELGQNYPNPHAGETTVPFNLNITADVRLIILDALGRKVAGVLRRDTAAGAQRIKLNLTGLGLPPGIYEYRLEASTRTGMFRQSRLMSAELG